MYKLAEVTEEAEDDYADVSSFSYPGYQPRRRFFSVYGRFCNDSRHEVPSLPPRILPLYSQQQEVESALSVSSEDSQEDINHLEKGNACSVPPSSSSCEGIVFQKLPEISVNEDVETSSSSTCFKNKENDQEGIEEDLTIGKMTYPPYISKNSSHHGTRSAKLIQHPRVNSVDESALRFFVSKTCDREMPAESKNSIQLAHSEIPKLDMYQESKVVLKIAHHVLSPTIEVKEEEKEEEEEEEKERHCRLVNKLKPASLEIADKHSRDVNRVLSSKIQENISQTPSIKQGVRNLSVTPCQHQENRSISATPVSQSVKKGSNGPGVRTVLTSKTHSQYCNQPVPSLIPLNTPCTQEEFGKKSFQEFQGASKSKKHETQNVISHAPRDINSKKLTPNHKICSRVQPMDNACVSEKKSKVICKNKENYSTPQLLEKPTNKVRTDKEQRDLRVPLKENSSEVKRVPSKDFKIPAKKTLFCEADVINEAHGSLSTKGTKEKVFLISAPIQEHHAGSHTSPLEPRTNFVLYVKKKEYFVVCRLGFGGSSQVYEVLEPKTHNLLAIKCVNLADTDPATAQGYLNEIELLSKLQKCKRVVKLFDDEYVQEQQILYVVMERGDTDFSTLLKMMSSEDGISMPMIIYYWTEMLSAVKDIHDHGVVHSDLKPANFLLVKGRLKLIDFGIASSVQNDMTSINKNGMAGTYNYMSPEAFHDPTDNNKTTKVGYKSDVWSLGCILYNMLYGKTPFHHLSYPAKMFTIINPDHKINYPYVENCPSVLMEAMKKCLTYNYKLRPTVTELLNLPYIFCDTPVKNGNGKTG